MTALVRAVNWETLGYALIGHMVHWDEREETGTDYQLHAEQSVPAVNIHLSKTGADRQQDLPFSHQSAIKEVDFYFFFLCCIKSPIVSELNWQRTVTQDGDRARSDGV